MTKRAVVNVQFKPKQNIHRAPAADSKRTYCGRAIPEGAVTWTPDEPRPNTVAPAYLVRCKRCFAPPVVTFILR